MKFHPARRHTPLTVGESVRIVRELQEMTRAELAERSGIAQPAVSGIESGRIALGVDRAKKLARALRVHPAVLLFPDWEEESTAPRRAAGASR
jgi:transcriptional regulator with XRE-family HTH domain